MRIAAAIIALLTGCTLLPTEIDGRSSAVPDRGVAPWWVEDLEVCIADDCDAGERVRGADVRWDGSSFSVIAEVDGELLAGELARGWRLELESAPVLSPIEPWHAGGLRDPAWIDADTVLFGVADQSAVGRAVLSSGESSRLWDAVDLGVSTVAAPTATRRSDRLAVAALVDAREIVMAWGADPTNLELPVTVLELADAEHDGWRDLASLADPSLDLTTDGLVALFFVAVGRETEAQPGVPAPLNASVGYAGSIDGETYELFGGNPVHDRAFSFLFHADETEPSVARNDDVAVMLYRDATDAGATLAIAVHQLD